MENEIWKDIPEYLGIYQVSNTGRVRSLDRIIHNNGTHTDCKIKGKVLTPNKDNGGYLYVGLYSKNKRKSSSVKIHRLVAFAFCDNYEIGKEANHKNGIRHDNRSENLEWVSRSVNIRDRYKRGYNPVAEQNNAAKLKNEYVGIIASLYDSGVKQPIIAKAFGVSQATISNVIKNKHYKNEDIGAGLAIDKRTVKL